MTQRVRQRVQRTDRAATLAHTAAGLVRGPGVIDDQVVRAVWSNGQLSCDRLLGARARLLVDLGVEFRSDDPPRRYHASLQAPAVAVLLTLIRACDLATALEVDLGPTSPNTWRSDP